MRNVLPCCFEDHTDAARTLSAVQDLARLGLSIIPIRRGDKKPPIRWKKYQYKPATIDQIQRWHEEFAGCNWASVWGVVSGNVLSVDIDSAAAFEWCQRQGGFNETPPVWFKTGDGWQYLYRLPDELKHSRKVHLSDELHFLINGQYSVIPPSIHETGRQYQWQSAPPTSLDDIPFAPRWVLDLITAQMHGNSTSAPNPSPKAKNPAKDRSQSTRQPVPENYATNPRILDADGYQLLSSSTFGQHSRHHAYLSHAITLRLSGLDQNKAAHELDQWRQDHTLPVYGSLPGEAKEPSEVLAAVYQNGYGLTVDGLMQAIDVNGERMPEALASELVSLMPKSRKRGERRNDPLFVSVARIIEVLYQRRIMKPTPITHDEMANLTGLSPDQVAKVAGFLEEIGIKSNARIGRSTVSLYNLNNLTSRPQQLIKQLARWRGYRIHWKAICKFLWRRVHDLMRAVLSHLNNVCNWITSTWQGETRQLAAVAVSGSGGAGFNRGPPS